MAKRRYEPVGETVLALIADVAGKYHPDLVEAEVAFAGLFVYPATDDEGQPKGPALTQHGYPAAAVIQVTGGKDRALGVGDVLLQIDADGWRKWTPAQRVALLDHELTHVTPKLREGGEPCLDIYGRPELKTRRHDFEVGGFHEVIRRHFVSAFEFFGLATAAAPHHQLLLEFMKDAEAA